MEKWWQIAFVLLLVAWLAIGTMVNKKHDREMSSARVALTDTKEELSIARKENIKLMAENHKLRHDKERCRKMLNRCSGLVMESFECRDCRKR